MQEASEDYRRVEAALRYLHDQRLARPSLSEVARQAGLSPYHFQRLFSRWAGVSPKRFVQFLGREHAKRLLDADQSVLDAALESGHSGPGRLHDLFVKTAAVTPGQYRSGGEGLVVAHGVGSSPFGACFVAATERGVCALAFLDADAGEAAPLARLRRDFPRAALVSDAAAAERWLRRVFPRRGDGAGERPAVVLAGSPFQLAVWQALLEVPEGAVTSYGRLSARLGRPGAARAVGNAVAQNPIAYLIPCHRVIREIGDSGEYRWGRERKRLMLAWESARTGDPADASDPRRASRRRR